MFATASTNGFNTFATTTNGLYIPSLLNGRPVSDLNGTVMATSQSNLLNGMPASDLNGTAIAVVGLLQLATCSTSMDTVIHNINNSKNLNIVDDKTGTTCVDTINNSGNITWLL